MQLITRQARVLTGSSHKLLEPAAAQLSENVQGIKRNSAMGVTPREVYA